MMFSKKSLGFHCWDEKDEVILCGKGEHTTPKMAGKCVFSHRMGAPQSRRGSVGAALGISAGYFFVSLLPLLAWRGVEVGHVSSIFQLLKLLLATLAHQRNNSHGANTTWSIAQDIRET